MGTIIALVIIALGLVGVVAYTVKRVLDTFQRQSMFIMAIKNVEALADVTNISIVEKDFAQKTRNKDEHEKDGLAESIYLSGEIDDKQMKEFDIG